MRCVSRSISPTLPRCLTTPLGRVQSFTAPNGPGSRGMPSSLAEKYSRSCGNSMPRQGDRTANARWQPRFRMLSSNGTAPEVDQVVHTEASGDFPQLRATGREETAQQPIPAKLLDLKLPALGATAQALENPGQLRRDRRLSLAKKPAGVVDQLEIASQRKAGNHAFTRRIQLATVLNRTKPQRLFQAGRRLRTSNASATGGFQFRGLARQKSTSQSIEPPAIDGKALQCGSFLTLYSEESKAQCLSFNHEGIVMPAAPAPPWPW
jgi:hypothetical protein